MKKKCNIFLCCLIFLAITMICKNTYATEQENEEETAKVEEGFYIIESAMDSSKVIDLNGFNKTNKENIQLWSKNYGSNQIFELIYDKKTSSYIIKSAYSGKVFDLEWGSKKEETNVEVYENNNVDWQKWNIQKTDDGYYSIKSLYSGLYLDVRGNQTYNGTNIEVYGWNNGKNQKFLFKKINLPKNCDDVENGFYQMELAKKSGKLIEIDGASKKDYALVSVWPNNSRSHQKFIINKKENGYYSVKNLNSDLYLEAVGTRIKQTNQDKNTIAQDWILVKNEDGYYNLVTRCGGLYLNYVENFGITLAGKTGNIEQKVRLNKNADLAGTQTIPDGYYTIKSSLNTNKVLDIESASIKAETNVLLWEQNNRNNQKFKFTYDGNGYYKITSVKSKKVLDVAWANKENESNVQQFNDTGSKWQKWIVEKNDDNTYSIISAYNGLYLDLKYGKTTDGTNAQLYTKNGGKNQKFLLEETSAVESKRTIQNNAYKIQPSANKNLCFDIDNSSKKSGVSVALWSNNNGYNQRFDIQLRENDFYIITVGHSKKALTVSNNSIVQSDINYSEEQEWAIEKNKNGSYYIISAHNGLCMNINGEINTGDKINISPKQETKTEYFEFSPTTIETGGKSIENGKYQIVTYLDNNKVLDIQEASNDSGANVEIWSNNRQNNQKFSISYQNNGYYKIIALNSGKALGVKEAGYGEVVDVRQYDVTDSINQDWIIKSVGNGYYNIISACNGLYLDLYNASTSAGTNIQAYRKTGGDNQKFKFEKATILEVTSGTYGVSGLKVKGDSNGQNLRYYKIGSGPNVYFATFAVHGFEDGWNNDGQVLTNIANDFKNRLISMQDANLAEKWTIYIFPSVNPDGEYHGWTNNGPGRTSLYSAAPNNKGIDINRGWSTGYSSQTKSNRNYNGTQPFQSYEARSLRDFLLNKKSQNGQTILVDLHGWLNETIGDEEIGRFYRSKYGMSKHIYTYGQGYLVNWARSNLGSNGRTARSSLVELPEYDQDSSKYINATIEMLRNIN